ncbi:hypothetical protein QQ045_010873 [Rhodiola kirilowii]
MDLRSKEEEHVKEQVTDDKITANELSVEEDKKDDKLEYLAKETEETDAEESKQHSKEIEDAIKEKILQMSVEDNKKKEHSATEGGSDKGTLEDGVEASILENEHTKTELTKELPETSVVKDIDEDVTVICG